MVLVSCNLMQIRKTVRAEGTIELLHVTIHSNIIFSYLLYPIQKKKLS